MHYSLKNYTGIFPIVTISYDKIKYIIFAMLPILERFFQIFYLFIGNMTKNIKKYHVTYNWRKSLE